MKKLTSLALALFLCSPVFGQDNKNSAFYKLTKEEQRGGDLIFIGTCLVTGFLVSAKQADRLYAKSVEHGGKSTHSYKKAKRYGPAALAGLAGVVTLAVGVNLRFGGGVAND